MGPLSEREWMVRDGFGEKWLLRRASIADAAPAQPSLEARGALQSLVRFHDDDSRLRRTLAHVFEALTRRSLDPELDPYARSGVIHDGLRAALFDGRLTLERLPRSPWPFDEEPEAPAFAAPAHAEGAVSEAFVALRLVDQDKKEVPRRGVRLVLADETRRDGFLDERGRFFLGDIARGTCTVSFPDLDVTDFAKPILRPGRDAGDAVGPVAASSSDDVVHLVEPGDTVSSIADRFGFLHAATIWSHPANTPLRDAREDPHALLPGDAVVVPSKRPPSFGIATDTETTLTVFRQPLRLKLRLLDAKGDPVDVDATSVFVDGEGAKPSAARGTLDMTLAPSARAVSFEAPGGEMRCDVGALPPLREVGGAEGRLENLGFGLFDPSAADDGEVADDEPHAVERLELALELFEASQGRRPTGKPERDVLEALKRRAGA